MEILMENDDNSGEVEICAGHISSITNELFLLPVGGDKQMSTENIICVNHSNFSFDRSGMQIYRANHMHISQRMIVW